jgi:hypothetical protein
MKITKLRLTLDMNIDPQGISTDRLKINIHRVIHEACDNGTFTEGGATLEFYNVKVTTRRPRKKRKDTTPTFPCVCAVCGQKAITTRSISIDNAPKHNLPVCEIHADAADEDNERAHNRIMPLRGIKDNEDAIEQQRRDEKNGLYPEHEDPSN